MNFIKFYFIKIFLFKNNIYIFIYISEVKSLSHVQLFATPWTIACQTPLSMGFPRQKY